MRSPAMLVCLYLIFNQPVSCDEISKVALYSLLLVVFDQKCNILSCIQLLTHLGCCFDRFKAIFWHKGETTKTVTVYRKTSTGSKVNNLAVYPMVSSCASFSVAKSMLSFSYPCLISASWYFLSMTSNKPKPRSIINIIRDGYILCVPSRMGTVNISKVIHLDSVSVV